LIRCAFNHSLTCIASAVLPLYSSHARRNSTQALKEAQAQEVTKHSRSRAEQLLSSASFPEDGKADIESIRPPEKEAGNSARFRCTCRTIGYAERPGQRATVLISKGSVSYDTLKALTSKPFNLNRMSPVQAEVLPLLPQITQPYSADPPADGSPSPPRDLLVKARTGTGKTLAFLVPAVEARLKSIEAFAKQAVKDAGLTSDKHMEGRARRVFSREHVGTLILSPTRELATQIANEALRLTHYHKDLRSDCLLGVVAKGCRCGIG